MANFMAIESHIYTAMPQIDNVPLHARNSLWHTHNKPNGPKACDKKFFGDNIKLQIRFTLTAISFANHPARIIHLGWKTQSFRSPHYLTSLSCTAPLVMISVEHSFYFTVCIIRTPDLTLCWPLSYARCFYSQWIHSWMWRICCHLVSAPSDARTQQQVISWEELFARRLLSTQNKTHENRF